MKANAPPKYIIPYDVNGYRVPLFGRGRWQQHVSQSDGPRSPRGPPLYRAPKNFTLWKSNKPILLKSAIYRGRDRAAPLSTAPVCRPIPVKITTVIKIFSRYEIDNKINKIYDSPEISNYKFQNESFKIIYSDYI